MQITKIQIPKTYIANQSKFSYNIGSVVSIKLYDEGKELTLGKLCKIDNDYIELEIPKHLVRARLDQEILECLCKQFNWKIVRNNHPYTSIFCE